MTRLQIDRRRYPVTEWDGRRFHERALNLDQVREIDTRRYDHVLDLPQGRLEFVSGDSPEPVGMLLTETGLGEVSLGVLQVVQLNPGLFVPPDDFGDLLDNENLFDNGNLARHVSMLRKVHQESCRHPRFIVTRREGGYAVMWPAQRTFLRVDHPPSSAR